MSAKHEAISYGDSTIKGERNEVIHWKLAGEGFTTCTPIVTGTLTFTGTGVTATAPYSIIALGDLRILQITGFNWTLPGAATALASGAIAVEHRPVARQMITTVGHLGAATHLFVIDVETTGVVTIRGSSTNTTGYGIATLSVAGGIVTSTFNYSVV